MIFNFKKTPFIVCQPNFGALFTFKCFAFFSDQKCVRDFPWKAFDSRCFIFKPITHFNAATYSNTHTQGWWHQDPGKLLLRCKKNWNKWISKQKLLKDCHQVPNVAVLAILERLQHKNVPCWSTMVRRVMFLYGCRDGHELQSLIKTTSSSQI